MDPQSLIRESRTRSLDSPEIVAHFKRKSSTLSMNRPSFLAKRLNSLELSPDHKS